MQTADDNAINKYGISGKTLMANAAEKIFREVLLMMKNKRKRNAVVFCGPGNNGGDGYATALLLQKAGIETVIYAGCDINELKGCAAFYAKQAQEKKIEMRIKELPENIEEYNVIIDALFGIGLSRKVKGIYSKYIELINNKGENIISADIPSGLHSDEGIPYDIAVKADLTVCFGKVKVSLVSQPGCEYTKKIIAADIGIPEEAYEISQSIYQTFDREKAEKLLVPRKNISSKGNFGKILVVAGSPGMTGAMSLCAEACYRSGAGLVYCAVPKSKLFEYDGIVREAISIPVEDDGKPYISGFSIKDIIAAAKEKSVVVIGPGLSHESHSEWILDALLEKTDIPVIADAQTLNDLSLHMEILKKSNGRVIITPHPGEMARLTGKSIKYIQNNRVRTAKEFAKEYKVIVLLKGHKTIVTDGSRIYLNTTGNPGMATAGSGDVLCGIIAACGAFCSDLTEAAALGAFIHGAAGDGAAGRFGEYSMKAGDIIEQIPGVVKNITGV